MESKSVLDIGISDILLNNDLEKQDKDENETLCLQYLPEEILENILSFLSPYKEMDTARLVSKQWYRIIKCIIKQRKKRFYNNLSDCKVKWLEVVKDCHKKPSERNLGSHITDRYSHSAAYLNGSMYVFGGCTSTNTTFNDLWRLDLATRQWIRPVAMGAYPSPKACATMVVYNGNLILFGGWSHPIPYPLHQSAHYFSELHVYNPSSNKWSHVLSLGTEPEALGGHSASVAGHLMVVFGGSPRPGQGTNNVWVFNFLKASWKLQPVCRNAKPEPRYGQFQTTLDDRHILVMGGCVGPNRPFNDLWLLTLNGDDPWQWSKIDILKPELSAPQTWCHAACKVQDRIVVISKCLKPRQAKNIKPHIFVSNPNTKKQHEPTFIPVPVSNTTASTSSDEEEPKGPIGENLLALQKKLHRDCVSLPDLDNHHHNSQRPNQSEPEGDYLRIQNRWVHNSQVQPQSAKPNLPVEKNAMGSQPSNPRPPSASMPSLEGNPRREGLPRPAMPSIRPNANLNRQRQLEALQRQEEILRSKSRALAAARKPAAGCSQQSSSDPASCEEVPEIIQTKNRMDVHVLDIRRVITDSVAEWRPISELQASCAPTETICSSLLEGRGELVMFGGVVRETSSHVIINTALSKLYILQA